VAAWLHLKANSFSDHVDQYVVLATSHFEEATPLYRAYGTEYIGWDPISANLPTLEIPNITLTINGLSVLVSVARESPQWIVENDPKRGPALIER